jgi:hypothetical protein
MLVAVMVVVGPTGTCADDPECDDDCQRDAEHRVRRNETLPTNVESQIVHEEFPPGAAAPRHA